MDETFLEILGLSKRYNQGHETVPVLENINFSMKKGEFTALLGPSGSGKSTLLNLIGLLDTPSAGQLRLFGRDAGTLDEAGKSRLRMKNIGFVFQFDSLLPEFTLLENVDLPARFAGKQNPGLARDLLGRFGLAGLADRFPMEVSGGEKQRAALARALRNGPQLILADEPTGNLDKHNAKLVLNDLKELADSGTAVILVTHNEDAAKYAARVLHLSDGEMTEHIAQEMPHP